MDYSVQVSAFPDVTLLHRDDPVLPDTSTVEGQHPTLRRGNLKHSAAARVGADQDGEASNFSPQISKQKRISFVTTDDSATKVGPTKVPAKTTLSTKSAWPAVARATSSSSAKKTKKKPLSVSPARTRSTPMTNRSVKATPSPSVSKAIGRVSKTSTIKLNASKMSKAKADQGSKPKAVSIKAHIPGTTKSTTFSTSGNHVTRMPMIKAHNPASAPSPRAKSKSSPSGKLNGSAVVGSTLTRFKSAPLEREPVAGAKGGRHNNGKKPETSGPASTAVSIELTAGLAETLIPKKRKPKFSEPKIKLPPRPDFQICTALPGTPEWDVYWKKFNSTMSKYTQGMKEYERGMEAFSEDLNRYRAAANNLTFEEKLMKSKDGQKIGLEMGIIPALVNYKLEGLHVLNGYIVKGKGFRGTVTSIPGQPSGMRVEIDVGGIDPDTILTQREHNMLTMSTATNQFVRIGCPEGVSAEDLEIWPLVNGIIMVDAP